ncbi:unnamed protein product [Ectocarpus sp. 12 AP-2014]
MDVSSPSSSLSPSLPVAKRQRYHLENGGSGSSSGSGGGGVRRERETTVTQVVFLDREQRERQLEQEAEQKARRQEEQELQLQLAFHRMGVRQRNSPPSPPLVSALPPKRPRTPGDDPGHGKRPRNG